MATICSRVGGRQRGMPAALHLACASAFDRSWVAPQSPAPVELFLISRKASIGTTMAARVGWWIRDGQSSHR